MDQPSGSNANFSWRAQDPEPLKNYSIAIRRMSSKDNDKRPTEAELKAKNIYYFSKNLRAVIIECEMRIRSYLKAQRLVQMAARDYNMYDMTEDSSNGGLSSSNEYIFSDFDEYFNSSAQRQRFERRVKQERLTFGSWLFLTSVEGGWNYEIVKCFFLKEYGVRCLRSRLISDRIAVDGEFKAIIRFKTSAELNRIVMSLKHKKLLDKFIFLSFDKMTMPFEESEDSEEEEEVEKPSPIAMIPKGI